MLFLLTPESLYALSQLLLASTLSIYLLKKKGKSVTLWLLGFSLLLEAVHHFINFFALSVATLNHAVSPLLGIVLSFSGLLLIQFAYRFYKPYKLHEARVVNILSIVSSTVLSLFLLSVFFSGKPHTELPYGFAILCSTLAYLILLPAWAIVVLLRKYFDKLPPVSGIADLKLVQMKKGYIVFSLLIALKVIVIGVSILAEANVISVHQRIYFNMSLHSFYLTGLVVAYANYAAENLSIQVKLVGITVAFFLLVLNLVSITTNKTNDILQRTSTFLPVEDGLSFNRDENGQYAVKVVEKSFDKVYGEPVSLDGSTYAAIAIPFTFDFFHRTHEEMFVHENGVLSFERPIEHLRYAESYMRQPAKSYQAKMEAMLYQGRPAIAALYHSFEMNASSNLFIKSDEQAITVTWSNLYLAGTDQHTTFQVKIDASGGIILSYNTLGAPLTDGAIGLYDGYNPSTLERLNDLPADKAESIIFNLNREFRYMVHENTVQFAIVNLGSVLLLLIAFPLLVRSILFKPIYRLLKAIKLVNAGKYDIYIPIYVRDEIGDLTEQFNQMTVGLCEAHTSLTAHNESLEAIVAKRTDQLNELIATKSRFFSDISHDLRTPLSLIAGPVQLLRKKKGSLDERDLDKSLVSIEHQVEYITRLLNQLSIMSQLDAKNIKLDICLIALKPYLQKTASAFESRALLEGKDFSVVFNADDLMVEIDPIKFEQVLYNIFDNAFKFTAKGDQIGLIVDNQGAAAKITIIDTGHGMDRHTVERAFNRFFKGERSTNGTGIGLSHSKELVELHNGTISLESEPGFGAKISIQIPRSENTPQPNVCTDQTVLDYLPDTIAVSRADTVYPKKEKRILIVDDCAEFRLFLKDILLTSYTVFEASNGKEGLTVAKACNPHLIITDISMPVMEGNWLCATVKTDEMLANIPVIMLTAHTLQETRIEGLQNGVDAFFEKPFDTSELLLCINNLIELSIRNQRAGKHDPLRPTDLEMLSEDERFILNVRSIIEKHISNSSFTIEELSTAAAITVRQLQRKVKQHTGLTPAQYIRTLRINRAVQLLAKNAGNIKYVAYRVGFRDVKYFSRVFKKQVGISPKAYSNEQ